MKLLKKILIFFVFSSVVILPGFGCKKSEESIKKEAVTLNYWSVENKGQGFADLIVVFQKENPNIKINYQEISLKDFNEKFLEAMAEEKGPDIFSLPYDFFPQYKKWIVSMPSSVSIKKITTASCNKVKEEKKTFSLYGQKKFIETFFDVISNALISENKIQGVVLSLDSLALFYNKDILNSKRIISPPLTWSEFGDDVLKITEIDPEKNILLSGASLGTSNNVSSFLDIVSVLMLQTGTEMVSSDKKEVFFNEAVEKEGQKYFPGKDALRFYTDFSNPSKSTYSYNPTLAQDIEFFSQGKLAMMFGYYNQLEEIKKKSPKINLGISSLPQIEGARNPINFAQFAIELVSKKSKYQNEAWYFLNYCLEKKNLSGYLEKSKKLTSRKDLLAEQKKNLEMEVFLDQLLTAKNWYKGDYNLTKKAFSDMIDSVVQENISVEKAIIEGASGVNEALRINEL